jgi:hypothetical protein
MTAAPLVPSPLFGLRTWSVTGGHGEERLAGPQRGTPWPGGGEWLRAECPHGHDAPARACACGVHAWHPSRRTAARVLGARGAIAGVVEAAGAVDVHREGFRAERARPRALFVAPRSNAALIRRLGAAHAAETVPVRGPADVVAWCAARGYGLEPGVVDALLGPEAIAAERRRVRGARLRVAGALVAIAVMLGVGLATTGPPGDRILNGRTGPIHVGR